LPDLLVSVWAGILVPTGTSETIINKLNTAINEGLKSPEVQASLAKLGTRPMIGTPQDFGNHIAAEARRWADIVNQSGAKLE
jgi:tripartite-type tricarboxylate transporter receptor subunit TctC